MPKHLSVATRKWEEGCVSETTHDKQGKLKNAIQGKLKNAIQRNKIRMREISMDNLGMCNLEIRQLGDNNSWSRGTQQNRVESNDCNE